MVSRAILEPLKKNLEGRGFGKVEGTSFPGDSDHQGVTGLSCACLPGKESGFTEAGLGGGTRPRERRSGGSTR